jgi:ketoreductase RED2
MGTTSYDFTGDVVLVTGASRGIGRDIALGFARSGAKVAVNDLAGQGEGGLAYGTASAADLDGTIAAIEELGAEGLALPGDVTSEQDVAAMVGAVVERFGRLDILVNNAGTTVRIPHHEIEAATPEVFRRLYDVNVVGTWALTVAAMPHLRASGAGCVVNVSSLAGVRPTGSSIPYAASKAALNHVTRLLANVVGPEVRVNAVAPGLVDTPWTESWDEVRAAVHAMAPLKRSAQPDDVAEVVLALIASTYVTGQVWVVDGGLSLR